MAAQANVSVAGLSMGRVMLALDAVAICCLWPLALGLAGIRASLALLLYPALYVGALYALGLYRRDTLAEGARALARLPLVALAAALGGGLLLWLAHRSGMRPDALTAGTVAPPGLVLVPALAGALAAGMAARAGFHMLRRAGAFRCRLLVLGAGAKAWDLTHVLGREGRHLRYDFTFVADPAAGPVDDRLEAGALGPVVRSDSAALLATAQRVGADQVVVAPDERRGVELSGLLACKMAGFPVREYLTFLEREVRRVDVKRIQLGWLLFAEGFRITLVDRLCKRLLDLAICVPLTLLFAPFVLLAALAIKLDDGGPVFYRQMRVTLGGRHFRLRKLRTMCADAERGGAVWAAQGDARVTRVGRFLRRTRIDEMPQLLNVLSGEMALVGPRPERPEFVAKLAAAIPLYPQRHMVKAGLTGWAQVNYPYGASIDDARSKLCYDLFYIKNFSVLFDLLIILQTIRVVFWPGSVR